MPCDASTGGAQACALSRENRNPRISETDPVAALCRVSSEQSRSRANHRDPGR